MKRPDRPSLSSILLGISQFRAAVAADYMSVDLDTVESCEQVVRRDRALKTPTLAFCLRDGEVFFQQRNGKYRLGFVCDLEWAGFDHYMTDLATQAIPGRPLVELSDLVALDTESLRVDPFFASYERASGPLDYPALSRFARYAQLSTWGLVAAEPAHPDKKQWIRDQRLGLINRLLEQVASTTG